MSENKRVSLYTLTVAIFLMMWAQSTADVLRDENSLNTLYDNLLQREYAGPVVFPNHQVERKAQRSPSLRLRFGRRSDPDLLPQSPEKRWFGDVNKKPIRSPSLRLRFGRRSDPSMPMHSELDMLMNGQQIPENNEDYNDVYGGFYDRVVRKPQRLRFGRSLPFPSTFSRDLENVDNVNRIDGGATDLESDDDNDDANNNALSNSEQEFFNSLMHSQKLRNLLRSLKRYAINEEEQGLSSSLEDDENFERAIRKPGPLRLRWGRSTGGRSSQNTDLKEKSELEQKKTITDISNDVDKTTTNQNKD